MTPSGLLSSGLDSFIVNKFLTKRFTNFKTYTLGFDQDSFDEIKNFNEEYEILPGHGPSDKVKTIKENNEFIKMLIDD